MAKNLLINGVTYNAVDSLAIPISGGGGDAVFPDTSSGTATEDQILDGEIAWVDGEEIEGTMPNRGAVLGIIQSTKDATYTIPSGYHSGSGSVAISSSEQDKIIAGNIKSGVTILGVAGATNVVDTTNAVNSATDVTLLSGTKAFVNGESLTGTMPYIGAQNGYISTKAGTVVLTKGYHSGSGSVSISSTEQAKIIPGNIKSGVKILGVAGATNVVDTTNAVNSSTNATLLSGKKAFVNGESLTGTMPNNAGDVNASAYHRDGTSLHIIPVEGYMDGVDDAVVITDTDYVATNIKKDVSVFGLTGTYEGSGGGAAANSIVITEVDANKRITKVDASAMTEIYPYMFYNYSASFGGYIYLIDIIMPANITTIGLSAFYNCTNLALTSLPDDLTSIGSSAFRNCTNLALTSLPDGLPSIGSSAFYGCTSLTKIWIPSSCTSITTVSSSAAPFYQCSSSLVIYCEAESKPAGWGIYWNYYSSSGQLTVNWGVTKEAFDAL